MAGVRIIKNRPTSLQEKNYNRYSFSGTSWREKLSPDYFAFSDCADQVIPFLEQMRENHRKLPYWKLVKYYCPCSVDERLQLKQRRLKFPRPSQKDLIADHTSVKSVHAFVCAVFKALTPLELFGSDLNRKCFLKNVHLLLSVQKYGEISLLYMVRGIRTSKIHWLKEFEISKQKELLLKCCDYLISKVIFPLVQSFFHFVESSYAKNKLFVFRKRVWHRLYHKAFADFAKFCNLSFFTEESFEACVKEKSCLGSARVSFILKKSSLRPISNLAFRDKGKASINDQLKTFLVVLTYIKDKYPSKFGAMPLGKVEFHKSLKEYILKVKKGGDVKKIYFVTADVEKCFDSINPTLLFEIMSEMIKADHYVVHRYRQTFYGSNQGSRYFESVHRLDYIKKHNGGDIEFINEYSVSQSTLLKILKSLLLFNVVKFGNYYYRQKKGISQGSKLSTILCSAYFGKIEETIQTPLGLYDFFVRIEDEYLVITSMKGTAKKFLESLSTGLKVYDLSINMNKCKTNCDWIIDSEELVVKSSVIKFFGLLIDPISLTVSSDYSSYNGLKASEIVTWKLCKSPGRYFKESVLKSLLPKSDFILFDKDVNSERTIVENVLQVFCMTAAKFHGQLMHLPVENRMNTNHAFFLGIIHSLPNRLAEIISQRSRKFDSRKQKNDQFPLPLSLATLSYLCNNVFLYKMKKHKILYEKIISELEKTKKKGVNSIANLKVSTVKKAFNSVYLK